MATPEVPPRPTRSHVSQTPNTAAEAPTVPPRPMNRKVDRSVSPRSAHYPRSPLNDSPFLHNAEGSNDLHRVASLNASKSSLDGPARSPSVSLPSIGQEGIEYEASTPQPEEEGAQGRGDSPAGSPRHTRKVSNDLPLHAPRPSLSSSNAKQRVAAVVRTDTNQASVVGVGGQGSATDKPLHAKPSFNRPASSSSHHERPASSYIDEHGVPIFGQHVPLGAQYGDVQAPSPAPFGSQTPTPGTATPGDSRPSTGRHHSRNKSGRKSFQAPPGSYGLHGHGVTEDADKFEKEWYKRHPEVFREEMSAHSPAILERHDYNLTPAELNELVKKHNEASIGASEHVPIPDEQIGYLATEAYASRHQTPRPSTSDNHRQISSSHQANTDSPLKGAVFNADDVRKVKDLTTIEDENGEGKVIHIDAPAHKESKHIGRGQAAADEHYDLGPHGGNTEDEGGWVDENGYGTPILASDEVDPNNQHLQPAVPPSESRRGSHVGLEEHGHSQPSSRPSSRPGSIHKLQLHRIASGGDYEGQHTPLEDVREYEPLFPEEDNEEEAKKPLTPVERFKKRPDMKQRFPSQDIWEDAPASVMMSTEVETPEPESQQRELTHPTFETPEAEGARKGEVSEAEKTQLKPREQRLMESNFKPHLLKQDARPGLSQQRFPSRDIWEDSPDSAYITTTVGDEGEDDAGLRAGAVVQTSARLPREAATAGSPALQPNGPAGQPVVPPRPDRAKSPQKENATGPQIPTRPARKQSPASADLQGKDPNVKGAKPSVPPRPAKPISRKSQETVPASGITADPAASEKGVTVDAAAPAKTKPPVPARPMGNKIAALQAGFMSDLNKKLGLGPQAPKKEEASEEAKQEEEKKPLEDARKGRARGPARRKPAASPSAAAPAAAPVVNAQTEYRKFVASPVFSLFEISPDGSLRATHADQWAEAIASKDESKVETQPETKEPTKDLNKEPINDPKTDRPPVSQEVAPAVGFNAQGEAVHLPTITPEAVKATSQTEGVPAMLNESEISAEPDDTGHAGISTSVGMLKASEEQQAGSTEVKAPESSEGSPEEHKFETAARQEIKTGVRDKDEGLQELKKQRTMSSSHSTQTGEMSLVMDKNGPNEKELMAYKDGSAHEEGFAFVEHSEKEEKKAATEPSEATEHE